MITRFFLKLVTTLILLIFAGLFYVSFFPGGLQFITMLSQKVLPLTFSSAGTLLSPEFNQVVYQDNQVTVKIKKLRFTWHPTQLLQHHVAIDNLFAEEVHVTLHPDESHHPTTIPWDIVLVKSNINALVLQNKTHVLRLRHLNADGSIYLAPIAWHLTINAKELDPALFGQAYSGYLNIQSESIGKSAAHVLTWQLLETTLTGMVNHYPLNARINAKGIDQALQSIQSSGKLATAAFNINATHNPAWSISWHIAVPNANELNTALHGMVNSDGSINFAAPATLQTHTNIQQFHYQQWSIANATLQLNARLNAPEAPIQGSLKIQDLTAPGARIEQLDLDAAGTNANHQIRLHSHTGQNQLQTLIQGSFKNDQWSGNIQNMSADFFPLKPFHLVRPSLISLDLHHINLQPVCLRADSGNLCFQLYWQQNKMLALNLNGSAIQLAELNRLVPTPVTLSNSLDVDMKITADQSQQFAAAAHITIHPGSIQYTLPNADYKLPLQGGTINAEFNQHGAKATTQLTLAPNETLSGQFSLPTYRGPGLPSAAETVQGHLKLVTDHLRLLPLLIPQLSNITGSLLGEFNITGTIGHPKTSGYMAIRDASMYMPITNVLLKPVEMRFDYTTPGQWRVTGSIHSGRGNLLVNGSGNSNQVMQNATLHLYGTNVTVSNLSEVKIIASPDLLLKINPDAIYLTGEIHIPSAKISPSYFDNSITTADDIVIVNNKVATKTPPSSINLYSRIKLILGDDVFLSYKGIETALGGELTIIDQPNAVTTAVGRLNSIKGKYVAYGQNLKISHGALIFTGGPIDNPGLDLQATKTIPMTFGATPFSFSNFGLNTGSLFSSGQNPTLKIGVNVQHSLQKPSITFFSQPAGLSQADILSYLLFGQPANNTSQDDKQTLLAAASALNLGGNGIGGITNQVKDALGLSDLSVSSDTEYGPKDSFVQNTSVVLGKYLSPRLYINYSIGLVQSINTFRVRYTLSHHWLVQADTNALGSGLDLFYTLESG